MALDYRAATVDLLYESIAEAPAVQARFPDLDLAAIVDRDDRLSRIKDILHRAPADFPRLRVMTGDNHSGVIFGAGQTFADEQGDGIPDFVPRQAQFFIDLVWSPNDQDVVTDNTRSAIETDILSAVAARKRVVFRNLTVLNFSVRQRIPVEVGGNRCEMTRITLNATYEVERDDVLPDGHDDDA